MVSSSAHNAQTSHLRCFLAELCDCIGDGLSRLRGGDATRVVQYIPDLDWRAVRDSLGPSKLYDHLLPDDASAQKQNSEDAEQSISQIVCTALELKEEDISEDVPLTSYGLDSLSAAALSFVLRPLVAVSQVQLLADLSIADLKRIRFEQIGKIAA